MILGGANTLTEALASLPGRCVHGSHLATMGCGLCQPTAPNFTGRDRGQSQATAAHPEDRARVEAAIRQLAASGRPFTANEARPLHGCSGPVVGAAFTAAAKAGLIKRVGYVPSTDPGTHAHPVAEWVAA